MKISTLIFALCISQITISSEDGRLRRTTSEVGLRRTTSVRQLFPSTFPTTSAANSSKQRQMANTPNATTANTSSSDTDSEDNDPIISAIAVTEEIVPDPLPKKREPSPIDPRFIQLNAILERIRAQEHELAQQNRQLGNTGVNTNNYSQGELDQMPSSPIRMPSPDRSASTNSKGSRPASIATTAIPGSIRNITPAHSPTSANAQMQTPKNPSLIAENNNQDTL